MCQSAPVNSSTLVATLVTYSPGRMELWVQSPALPKSTCSFLIIGGGQKEQVLCNYQRCLDPNSICQQMKS